MQTNMGLLDNNLDISEKILLINICIKYFENHGYWGGSGYDSFYPYNTKRFYDYDCYDNIIKNPKKYALYVVMNIHEQYIALYAVPRSLLKQPDILSNVCRARFEDTNQYYVVTINDILESYEHIG